MLLIFTIRVSRLAFLITIRSPVFIGTRVSPSKYAMPCSMPPSLEGPSSTSITSSAGKTMLLVFRVCGASGVISIRLADGEMIGPPAERL